VPGEELRGRPGEPHPSTWLPAVGAALLPYLWLVHRFDWLCDDAFISFRYARHLVEGHGLVFNVGESPPVEGYSNLLWVLAMAPFEDLGLDLGVAARLVSVACGVALLALVARSAARELELGALATSAVALLFACLPSVAIWSTGGLETMAFALALFGVFERTCPRAPRPGGLGAGLWAVLAAGLRADGALWAAAVLAVTALFPDGATPLRERARRLALPLGLLALTTVLHVAWRIAYYEAPLPNTAYAKAGASLLHLERGLLYVASYLATNPTCLLVPLAAFAAPGRRSVVVRRALLVCAFAIAWAVYTGGDFMPMGRFLVPAMPFVALVFGALLASHARRGPTLGLALTAGVVGLTLLPAFDVHPVPAGLREHLHFRWGSPERLTEYEQWETMKQRLVGWELTARALALHTEPGESLVFGALGAVGYRTELFLFDPYGLVSPEVARASRPLLRASPGHDRWVPPEFFLKAEPDYLAAVVVPTSAPRRTGLEPGWRDAPWASRLRIERHALPEDQGFPPDLELRLVRLLPHRG